jgi:hypothetical protein
VSVRGTPASGAHATNAHAERDWLHRRQFCCAKAVAAASRMAGHSVCWCSEREAGTAFFLAARAFLQERSTVVCARGVCRALGGCGVCAAMGGTGKRWLAGWCSRPPAQRACSAQGGERVDDGWQRASLRGRAARCSVCFPGRLLCCAACEREGGMASPCERGGLRTRVGCVCVGRCLVCVAACALCVWCVCTCTVVAWRGRVCCFVCCVGRRAANARGHAPVWRARSLQRLRV